MSRRKRGRPKPGRWLWLLGALVGATGVYFAYRPRASGDIPRPGEDRRSLDKSAPSEQIGNHEREALDRVLRERTRRR